MALPEYSYSGGSEPPLIYYIFFLVGVFYVVLQLIYRPLVAIDLAHFGVSVDGENEY